MKIITSILLFSIVFNVSAQTPMANETTTYYFIRHAEKDKSDKTNKDPHLNESGKKRAENWSQVFKNITFDAIYSTNYNRTKETAQPTANLNELEVTIYDPRSPNVKQFLKDNHGKTVLVVGHSNTTPMFVNAILERKKYSWMDENTNSHLYTVTIVGDTVSDQLLVID